LSGPDAPNFDVFACLLLRGGEEGPYYQSGKGRGRVLKTKGCGNELGLKEVAILLSLQFSVARLSNVVNLNHD